MGMIKDLIFAYKEIKEVINKEHVTYYHNKKYVINIKKQKECLKEIRKYLFIQLFNAIMSPICYIIWYLNRYKLTKKLQKELIKHPLTIPNTREEYTSEIYVIAKKTFSKFWFFMWTFGDINDPLNTGGTPVDYKTHIKSLFIRRFLFRSIRNPRSIYIHHIQTSDPIIDDLIPEGLILYDTRDMSKPTENYGTGDGHIGSFIRYYISYTGKIYMYYERCTKGKTFYIGFCKIPFKQLECGNWVQITNKTRFEISYRTSKLK